MTERRSGHRGLRESHAPHLALSNFRTVDLPSPPPSGGVTQGLTDWKMLGNGPTPENPPECPTGAGDCGAAAWQHGRMAKAIVSVTDDVPAYEPNFVVPTTPRTLERYFAYGRAQGEPGQFPDQGVTNATWLKWLYDHKLIDWFGELDPTDADEMHAVLLAVTGVLLGVGLTATAEPDFVDHRPWHVGGPPDHDVYQVAYTPSDFTVVTWGGLQLVTGMPAEAWAFGTAADAQRAGYDFEAIVDAIDAAGGTVTGSTDTESETP